MPNDNRVTNEKLMNLGRAFLEARFKNLTKQPPSTEEPIKGAQDSQAQTQTETLTRSAALEILDLKEGATEQDIRAAYHRLMQQVHPDKGGSTFFAKQLNAARHVLLQ